MDLFTQEVEEFKEETAEEAGGKLSSYVDEAARVGDLLSLDYLEATVLVHDALRQEVGGLPMGCFLIATRMAPETKPDANKEDTALILLRVVGHSLLPNRMDTDNWRFDAARRSIDSSEQWDADNKTDQFTLNQLRHAGVRCSVLGTFRFVQNSSKWNLNFGADISNFYSGQGMKVYKPMGKALLDIVNFTKAMGNAHPLAGKPVPVGRVRYASSEITVNENRENVSVHIEPTDMLARRTALFGMSRSGKSNTIKTIASAIFALRKLERKKGRTRVFSLRRLDQFGVPVVSKLILSRVPVARAIFCNVLVDGWTRPLSSRAMTDCVVCMRSASCACVSLAPMRASISTRARSNSGPSSS